MAARKPTARQIAAAEIGFVDRTYISIGSTARKAYDETRVAAPLIAAGYEAEAARNNVANRIAAARASLGLK